LGVYKKKYIIYSPLLGRVYWVDEEAFENIKSASLQPRYLRKFTEVGIYVDKNIDLFPKPKKVKFTPSNHLTIFLSTLCNLRCIYCYAEGGQSSIGNQIIDFDFIKDGIDYVTVKNKPLNISFHGGGEPFLMFDLIKKTISYAKVKTKKVNFSIQTNGTILSDKIDWILENMNHLTISCDGPPHIQNIHRPTANNKPSSQLVEKAFNNFDEYGWINNISIRSTISSFSVDKLNQLVEYFHKFGIKNLQFEALALEGRAIHPKETEISSPELGEFADNLLKAIELAEDYNMSVHSTLLSTKPTSKFCATCGSNFCLTADSCISSCYEVTSESADSKEFIYGQYNKKERKIKIDENKINFLGSRTIYNIPKCQNCIIKWVCGGGCLVKTFQCTRDIFKPDEKYCNVKRRIFKDFLKFRIEKDIINKIN
jgi:uncharacterized protein